MLKGKIIGVLSGFWGTDLSYAVLCVKNITLSFYVGRSTALSKLDGYQRKEMREAARRNYERVKAGVSLKRDYNNTTPPPHSPPFDDIRAVWGIQTSGKHGFVIDESELPY